MGPVLVLTGDSPAQEKVFHAEVPAGGRLRLFGAIQPVKPSVSASPEAMVPAGATNYRRWWNNPWSVVEKGGQREAGEWTPEENARLRALVRHAHAKGLWIRFYTLNGHASEESLGWYPNYNFGSIEAVRDRWQAAIDAGVDFIATDQYEELSKLLSLSPSKP